MTEFIDIFTHAACQFVERWHQGVDWTFQTVNVNTPDNRLRFASPPRIGDKISIGTRVYKAVDVMWDPPSLGSVVWPYPSGLTKPGVSVTVLVEAAMGLYVGEEETDENETDED